jgi:hypothetical protein
MGPGAKLEDTPLRLPTRLRLLRDEVSPHLQGLDGLALLACGKTDDTRAGGTTGKGSGHRTAASKRLAASRPRFWSLPPFETAGAVGARSCAGLASGSARVCPAEPWAAPTCSHWASQLTNDAPHHRAGALQDAGRVPHRACNARGTRLPGLAASYQSSPVCLCLYVRETVRFSTCVFYTHTTPVCFTRSPNTRGFLSLYAASCRVLRCSETAH